MQTSCRDCRKRKKCQRKDAINNEGCELISLKNDRNCFICGAVNGIEEHHIFGGSNRKKSDKEGLTVDLCFNCHRTGRNAVHVDSEKAMELKKLGQRVYEQAYEKGSFLKEFGKNYDVD